MNCDVSEKRHMWKEAEVSQSASNVRRGRLSFLASYLFEYLLARLQRNKTHVKLKNAFHRVLIFGHRWYNFVLYEFCLVKQTIYGG